MSMSLSNVPAHLTIRILYSDDDIVVIDKPCDLRSVPGHAENQPPRDSSDKISAQGAWVKAIQLLSASEDKEDSNDSDHPTSKQTNSECVGMEDVAVKEIIKNLGAPTSNVAGVPRKLETFIKYCHRNSKRLLPSFTDLHTWGSKQSITAIDDEQCKPPVQKKQKHDKSKQREIPQKMRNIAQVCFAKIQQKQRSLMNLPKPTEDWESATGQLHLLGFGEYSHWVSDGNDGGDTSKLYVVHRLDCQTSGIMVVARNQESASYLCKAWREREVVKKVYLAHVKHWPPYHQGKENEGTIDNIPLAASRTERIKWEVCPIAEGGKECETYWKLYEDHDKEYTNGERKEATTNAKTENKGVTLELSPITGRTHQLRIHCAEIGSGIVGDSLYGDAPVAWFGNDPLKSKLDEKQQSDAKGVPKTLRLHAHKLTFPHPKTKEKVSFESPKSW